MYLPSCFFLFFIVFCTSGYLHRSPSKAACVFCALLFQSIATPALVQFFAFYPPLNLAYTFNCWQLARSQLKWGYFRTNYQGTRSVLPNKGKFIVHLRTRTADRNFQTEFCRTDCISCHCKSLFLLRLHHRIFCFVKPENKNAKARGPASIKLSGGTFTKNAAKNFFARNRRGIRCHTLHLFLYFVPRL